MKEKIYTIQINEAMEKESECSLCSIEKDMEAAALGYFLGPAMMEPDVRIHTNERGFCSVHTDKMFEGKNVLPMALMLQSRVDSVIKRLEGKNITKKKKLFKKEYDDNLGENLKKAMGGCAVCERVESQMTRCIQNFAYMLLSDDEFKEKFLSSKGLCLKHFAMLLSCLKDEGAKDTLLSDITKLEMDNMKRLSGEISYFVSKFDYRNKDAAWNGTEDSPKRLSTKLSGGER